MRASLTVWTVAAALTLLEGGCSMDGDEHRLGANGAAMFQKYCQRCHGSDGAGNFLRGTPPNRTTDLSQVEIADRVQFGGGPHSKMPTFPKLSRNEALLIAGHVLDLKARSGGQGVFWMYPLQPPPQADTEEKMPNLALEE